MRKKNIKKLNQLVGYFPFTHITIYWVFLLFLIFVFTFLVAPFQKPDEQTHFLKAMALAKGQFQCKSENGKSFFVLPDSVVNFPDRMNIGSIMMRPGAKFPIGVLKNKYSFTGDTSKNTTFNFCIFPSLGYVSYALMALVSYPFNNLLVTFYFMRIISAILFFISVIISFYIIPKRYRVIIMFFSAIPMVVHQATAISYDAAAYASGIILFSYTLALLDKKTILLRELLTLLLVTVLFTLVKFGYYFVFLFPLILLFRLSVKNLKWYLLCGAILSGLFGYYFIFADNARAIQSYILQSQTSVYIQMMVQHPSQFLSSVMYALLTDSESLIQGMIGYFGWLDYTLSPVLTNIYVLIGGCVLYGTIQQDKKIISFPSIIAIFGFIVLNVLLIFSYYYIIQTPVLYYKIIGVQGRYFIIFIPFLVFTVSQLFQYVKESRKVQVVASCMVSMIIIFGISSTIYNRYFNYEHSFSNPETLKDRLKKDAIDINLFKDIPINTSMSFVSEFPVTSSKVGGFQLLVKNESEVTMPYMYTIKDSACKKTLQSGYFDHLIGPRMAHIWGERGNVYAQYFTVTKVQEQFFCIELIPMGTPNETPLILLGKDAKKPFFEFLSIIQ